MYRCTHGYEWLAGRGSFFFSGPDDTVCTSVIWTNGKTHGSSIAVCKICKEVSRCSDNRSSLGFIPTSFCFEVWILSCLLCLPNQRKFRMLGTNLDPRSTDFFWRFFFQDWHPNPLFFSFPNPQRTNTCFLWLLASLENTNRLRRKASSMHLFVEIYPRTFAGTSWKFRDP